MSKSAKQQIDNDEGLIVVRYGEIALKGRNRKYFVNRLRKNIQTCLTQYGIAARTERLRGRIYTYVPIEQQNDAAEMMRDVLGIVSLSPATRISRDLEAVKSTALRIAQEWGLTAQHTFRIRARRADKSFPHTSPEIDRIVGAPIATATGATVDLSDGADLTIGVEVHRDHIFLFHRVISAWGGLPVGTQGRVVALMSGGIDSPVAAWYMMRRGCKVIPLHFRQNDEDTAKTLDNCRELARYSQGWEIKPIVIEHAEILQETYRRLQELRETRWTCLMCKRAMLRKAEEIAVEMDAAAIVTGDSLGQVASQTVENLEVISYGITKPILRPLIGMDKQEVVDLARRIGTFDISTRVEHDCPYLPANPLTRGSIDKLRKLCTELKP